MLTKKWTVLFLIMGTVFLIVISQQQWTLPVSQYTPEEEIQYWLVNKTCYNNTMTPEQAQDCIMLYQKNGNKTDCILKILECNCTHSTTGRTEPCSLHKQEMRAILPPS